MRPGQARFLGGALLSAEAGQIVGETLRAHPLAVGEAMLRNTLRQLVTAGIGDTLGPEHLAAALRPRIAEGFPPREVAAFDAGMQARGDTARGGGLARAMACGGAAAGGAAGAGSAPGGPGGRGMRWRWPCSAPSLLGVVANAAATGGLSGVFPRYQARIAWLLPVAADAGDGPAEARMIAVLAILIGAAMLLWPALLNGYPLVFIDSVSYLGQALFPEWPWDKTPVYGAFLPLFHWGWSLWGPAVAQVVILSHLLWLTQRGVRGVASVAGHLLLCAGLAGLTAAPWFAVTLMPDIFAATGPLCLLLLGFARDRLALAEAAWLVVLGAFSIAAHLSHLPTAVVLVAFIAVAARQLLPALAGGAAGGARGGRAGGRQCLGDRPADPLAAWRGVPAGAAAGGRAGGGDDPRPLPACRAGTCAASSSRLPMDSDAFLWDAQAPPNRTVDGQPIPMGGMRLAPEAAAIIGATLRERPIEVAEAMADNTLLQLQRFEVGDTLGDRHLAASARRAVARMPLAELTAFDEGAQMRGELPALAAPWLTPQVSVVLLSLPLVMVALLRALWRGDGAVAGLLAGMLLAVLVNAFATGALSVPVDRYQARIIWLLPLAAALGLAPRFGIGLTDAERVRARMSEWQNSSSSSPSS